MAGLRNAKIRKTVLVYMTASRKKILFKQPVQIIIIYKCNHLGDDFQGFVSVNPLKAHTNFLVKKYVS